MKAKSLITLGLLVFVGISVVVSLRGDRSAQVQDPNVVDVEHAQRIESGVVVYYFHRTARCETCNKIENYTRQIVDASFPDALEQGMLQMLSLDYELSANKHFVQDFELASNSVILARIEDGKVTQWTNLDRIWDLVGDYPSFFQYILTETQAFMAGAA